MGAPKLRESELSPTLAAVTRRLNVNLIELKGIFDLRMLTKF